MAPYLKADAADMRLRGEGVQLEEDAEQLMSCRRRLGSRAPVVVVRTDVISF